MSSCDVNTQEQDYNRTQKPGRKGTRKPSTWLRNVAKFNRNTRKDYVSVGTGRLARTRQTRPPCQDGCFHYVTLPISRKFCSEYCVMANYDAQTSYIQNLTCEVNVKRKRFSKALSHRGRQRDLNILCSLVDTKINFFLCAEQHFYRFWALPVNRFCLQFRNNILPVRL